MPELVQGLHWLPAEVQLAQCPVCSGEDARTLLELQDPHGPEGLLRFLRCAVCSSVFLADLQQHLSHDEDLADDLFLTWYLETGAGIEAMVQPLVALPLRPGSTLLDIGCGYGLTVWFSERHLGLRGLGLERAPYGQRGARVLDVEVLPAYVEDLDPSERPPFDVLYASEVIEHVVDPRTFLADLRRMCAPGGQLVLTTPDADVVNPDRPAPVVVEALSPGLHRYLITADRLRVLLAEAGFPHQHLVRNGGHLVVWASDAVLPEPVWAPLDGALHTAVLQELMQSSEPALVRGAAYRLFREHVVAGRLDDAAAALDGVRAAVERDMGLDPLAPGLVPAYRAVEDPGQRIGRWPTFLGTLLHWAGMLATLRTPSDVGLRVRLFADSLDITRHDVATAPQFAHEAAAVAESTQFHLVQACLQTAGRELPLLLGTRPDGLSLTSGLLRDRTLQEVALLAEVTRPPVVPPPAPLEPGPAAAAPRVSRGLWRRR